MTARPRTNRLFRSSLLIAAGVIATACGDSTTPASPTTVATVSSITVAAASTSGQTFQATAVARLSDGSTREVTSTAAWASSDSTLATVSSTGLVTVRGGREFDVRATSGTITGSLHIQLASFPVAAVVVGGPSATSESFHLTASARLSDGSSEDVTAGATWRSSDESLATVSANGYVTVVGSGDVEFVATFQNVSGVLRVRVTRARTLVLSGTVADAGPGGRPLAGARIQIFGAMTLHILADDRGVFSTPVLAGRQVIEVSLSGYTTWSTERFIIDDTTMTVVLSPLPATGSTVDGRR